MGYETNEDPLCGNWWWYPSTDGVTVEEACCHCKWDCCANTAPTDWVDDAGFLCQWYIDNEPAGCPTWFDYPGFSPSQGALTAAEACCHCSCNDYPVGGSTWIDDSGVSCDWYTFNEPPGCPTWGFYPGTDGSPLKRHVASAENLCQM